MFVQTLLSFVKSAGTVFSLSISNLCTTDSWIAKFTFLANFYLSTPLALFTSDLLHNYTNIIQFFCFYSN